MARPTSYVFVSLRSVATTRESVDEASHDEHALGDVFREFGRVPLYSEIPPRLRGPSQFENLPDEIALVSIFGRLDSVSLCRCACVCSQLRKWADNNRLWMRLSQQRWGIDVVKRVGKSLGVGGWKAHFRERSLEKKAAFVRKAEKHREVQSSPLSLERMHLQDSDKKMLGDKARPMRSQLEAACVYMPKSNQDIRNMEMVRMAHAPEPQPPQKSPSKTPKKTRRGRRGRGKKVEEAVKAGSGGGSTDGLTVRQASNESDQERAAQDARAARLAGLGVSPAGIAAGMGLFGSGGSGSPATTGRMAPSPPLEQRRAPSPRSVGGRRTPSDGDSTTRGHQLKPTTPPTHLHGRTKQPTPPPSDNSSRRRDIALRAFGTFEAPPPAPRSGMPPRSFDDMPSSNYGSCVTPTRGHNVEEDDTVSSDEEEDEDDAAYSNLCHPIFDSVFDSPEDSPPARCPPASSVNAEFATRVLTPPTRSTDGDGPSSADLNASPACPPCPWHGTEVLDMYCTQCKMLVCNRCCLFGHHSGHPRISAAEAYTQVRSTLDGSSDQLERLAAKCTSYEERMQVERERVAKSRAAMKKSLRSSVKSLRDMLNQKQNELMEVIRTEEETKLKGVSEMGEQLCEVRKELEEGKRSLGVVEQVKKDCPYVIESANALEQRTTNVEATLAQLDSAIATLPQVAEFKFHLNDSGLREKIEGMAFVRE